MVAVVDGLHLTHLVAIVPGLSAVTAAAILAETGDPACYDTPRTWVKQPGPPRELILAPKLPVFCRSSSWPVVSDGHRFVS